MAELNLLFKVLSSHPLISIGVFLVIGYALGKLAETVKLPEITGYIIAGLLIGYPAVKLGHIHFARSLSAVSETALGLIAISIGGEFHRSKLKRLGRNVVIITMVQLVLTFAIVSGGMVLLGMPPPFALMLGAIASATAPAATVAIVKKLRARGTFIDYLYGVVALDDAGCAILFGVVFALSAGFFGDAAAGGHPLLHGVLHAVREVGGSIGIGLLSGTLIHFATYRLRNRNEMLIISLGLIFATIACAILLHLSPLITNMTAGFILINLSSKNHRIFEQIDPLTPPIFALFFILAGTELQPDVFLDIRVLGMGITYILLRAAGKYFGVFAGGLSCRTAPPIRNYLGFCMFPQAGVAIALVTYIKASPVHQAMTAAQQATVVTLINIVMFAVFVNELIGPSLSRFAIIRGNRMEDT